MKTKEEIIKIIKQNILFDETPYRNGVADRVADEILAIDNPKEEIRIKVRQILVDYHRRDDYDLKKAEDDMLSLLALPLEVLSDDEIRYRATLHAGVPSDDPDLYGSSASEVFNECIRTGQWVRDEIIKRNK